MCSRNGGKVPFDVGDVLVTSCTDVAASMSPSSFLDTPFHHPTVQSPAPHGAHCEHGYRVTPDSYDVGEVLASLEAWVWGNQEVKMEI